MRPLPGQAGPAGHWGARGTLHWYSPPTLPCSCGQSRFHPQTIHGSNSYRSQIGGQTQGESSQSTCVCLGQRPGLFSDVGTTGNCLCWGSWALARAIAPHHQRRGSLALPIAGIRSIPWQGIPLPTGTAHRHAQSYSQKKQALSLRQLTAWRKKHHLWHVLLCHQEQEQPVKDVTDKSGICTGTKGATNWRNHF